MDIANPSTNPSDDRGTVANNISSWQVLDTKNPIISESS